MQKIAKIVSLLLGLPWVIVILYSLLTYSGISGIILVKIALVSLVFHILIPMGYFLWAVRKGKITDFDITKREQRYSILELIIGSGLVSLFFLYPLNTFIFHILVILLVYISIVLVITLYWKISLHMGVNVIGAILFNFAQDWRYPILFVVIPIIFWSRYVLKKHTPAQLIVGAMVSSSVFLGGLYFFGYL